MRCYYFSRGRIANDAIKAPVRLGYRSGLENPCLSRYGPAVKGESNGIDSKGVDC